MDKGNISENIYFLKKTYLTRANRQYFLQNVCSGWCLGGYHIRRVALLIEGYQLLYLASQSKVTRHQRPHLELSTVIL